MHVSPEQKNYENSWNFSGKNRGKCLKKDIPSLTICPPTGE
jgi:hypothetical protein